MTNLEPIWAVIGLVFVAMITPGPNNFIVMSRAARFGLWSAASAAAGVLVGAQLLLTVVWFGADLVFDKFPFLQIVIMVCGAGFLAIIGAQMAWQAMFCDSETSEMSGNGVPDGVFGLAAFQFLNPKSWVLVLAAVAALGDFEGAYTGLMFLAVIFF